MSMIRWWSRVWRNLAHRGRVEEDLDAELRAYVDLLADQKIRLGMSPEEAQRAARAEAAGVEQAKEAVRDVWAGALLESLVRDFRLGARVLSRNPGFTAAALLMLAVGIGANTAVFSVLNALVLRELPYSEPERIVALYEKRPREGALRTAVSAPDFLDWRAQSTSFEKLAAIAHADVTWQAEGGAERIPAAIVSPEFFDVYGVRMAAGSDFPKQSGGPLAVVLTHGFWQRRFGADRSVIGRPISIAGSMMEIAGVLPAGFEYPIKDVELFVPLIWRSPENLDRASHEYIVAGRLKRGVTLGAAQVEMDGIASRLESQYPVNKGHGANVVPLADVLLEPIKRPLFALQAAAALVLLIACGNLASLLLARMLARDREMSIRVAAGAGRGHLMRQLLCEGALLALAGGALGAGVAMITLPLLRLLIPPDTHVVGLERVGIDAPVLLATLLLSLLCALALGLAPAWRGLGISWKEGLSGGHRRRQVRSLLIASQIAIAAVLLTGTVMLLRSFISKRSVDPGFQASGVLTMQVALPGSRFREAERVLQFTNDWSSAIRHLPGVHAVGLTSHLPVSGMDGRRGLVIKGVEPSDPNVPRRAHVRWVSPGYFEAMGLRIVQGRAFLETDRASSQPVMIVNETAARRYFPTGKAVGHQARLGGSNAPWNEVVGVVADVRHWGLDVEPNPEQYYSHLQQPSWMVNMVVRASGDLPSLVPSIRQELHRAADSGLPLTRVQTMEELLNRSMASERSVLILLGIFGGIALLLTAAGVWGTTAYLLSQRKREIGIRLALGADERAITGQVVRGAMKVAAIGGALGIMLSILLIRAASIKLFGVDNADPSTYSAVLLTLAVVAWLANYIPARRIVRGTPLDVLRQE
ncbi:MAG: ABC transporter permease [Acidobacteria bacterium]|nr:ABC transporter permease [Acidobacteriota bacterium]